MRLWGYCIEQNCNRADTANAFSVAAINSAFVHLHLPELDQKRPGSQVQSSIAHTRWQDVGVLELQASLQRTLQMEGQAFHFFDVNGNSLNTDVQVAEAVAHGHARLVYWHRDLPGMYE